MSSGVTGVRLLMASRRLQALAPYVFAALDAKVAEPRGDGRRIIDLGRADPDHPAPPQVIAALAEQAGRPGSQHYAPFVGIAALRQSIAHWYADHHQVDLDPQTQVLPVPGSKDGLFDLALAVCDPGDVALVPDPGYPTYRMGPYFAGAEVVSLPLLPERGYLPDLAAVPEAVARRARLLYLNYPNNPTGATAPAAFLAEAAAFARRHGMLLCHDLAYAESGYDGYRPPSVLSVEGGDAAVEFISWSKTFCMPGWRLGAAVGNPEALAALTRMEEQIHSGVFSAIQHAGAVALDQVGASGFVVAMNETYRARRDVMVDALTAVGVSLRRPRATPFLWFACPPGRTSAEFAAWLLAEAGVALAPGAAFGAGGEGFLRLSLTASGRDIEEAAQRLRDLGPEAWQAAAVAVPPTVGRATVPPPQPIPEGSPAPGASLLGCL